MPEGMGALLGSFVGLLAVAIAAGLGFRNLRRGHDHNAELARRRDERLHRDEARMLAENLAAEAAATGESFRTIQSVFKKLDPSRLQSAEFRAQLTRPGPSNVFLAAVPRIAILGSDLASDVIYFHHRVERLRRMVDLLFDSQVQQHVIADPAGFFMAVVNGLEDDLPRLTEKLHKFADEQASD